VVRRAVPAGWLQPSLAVEQHHIHDWTRGLSLAAVAWGALAFGGVYAWAYWPLAALCLLAGLLGFSATSATARAVPVPLSIALALCGIAILAQLIPLPLSAIAVISPASAETLRSYSPTVAAGLVSRHPLSIQPSATWTALGLLVSFAVLLLGTTHALSVTGARRLVEGLTILGVALALVGIIQKPLFVGKIYGLWTPEQAHGTAFGPFVNRNHFAGWMLMGLPLSLGLFCAGVANGMRGLRPGWRYKLLWLASPDANRLILIAAAAVVMAFSLVLTMSRSGITALALSLLVAASFVMRSLQNRWRKAAAIVYLVLLATAVVSRVGTDTIVARFSTTGVEFEDRRGAWEDALAIGSAFPIAGTGLNTYSIATLFYQRHDLKQHYEQAHNDYLQVFAEGGALLAIPAVLAILALFVVMRRRIRDTATGQTAYWLRAGAITAIIAIALQELVDFSLQMPGNAAMFALVCAIALHRPPRSRRVADV
jgi:O-antigen ligase